MGARLEAAFKQKAAYLIYEDSEDARPSLLERQVECTKAPMGMRIFMNLAFRGEDGIGAYVADRYDRTLRFWELIEARPASNASAGRSPTSSASATAATPSCSRLRERLLAESASSSARPGDGERWLRMTVTRRHDEETIEGLLDAIEEVAAG